MNCGNYTIEDTITTLTADWHIPIFTKSEVERAVEQCLQAGWIKVLSEQDCEKDRLRWIDDPNQIWSESLYRAGCVDLTLAGWNVFAQMQDQKQLPLAELYRQDVHYLWRILGRVSLLSISEEELVRELAEVRSGLDGLVGGGLSADHTIGEIIGPYAIGSWWVNRFYLAPYGYRADISFEPAYMHNL